MDNRPSAIYRALISELNSYIYKPPVEVSGYGPPAYVKAFAASHMADNFLKKFVVSSETADEQALKTFLASNKKCQRWSDARSRADLNESDHLLLNQFQVEIDNLFLTDFGADTELSWPNILENSRSGPGVSVGASGSSYYAKHFSSNLTTTSMSLYNLYRAHNWLIPGASPAEIIRQENYGSPVVVEGSSTSFVPKNVDTSRMICSEPILNMYLQLGLGTVLERRLMRRFGIDLSVQPDINRYLARLGSNSPPFADRGHVFCTIDLKSASDSVSLGLIGAYLPPEWTSVLLELRSPKTRLKGKLGAERSIELAMVSTMGNGFTFPLQTALFSCVVSACLEHSNYELSSSLPAPTFSVFGDDIIVPKRCYARVCRLLSLLGFDINAEKSFESGPFRESCGHDYYCGYNVRPVYFRKLDGDADLTVVLNLLNEWTARVGIPLPQTVAAIWSMIRKDQRYLVPLAEGVNAGIRVPLSLLLNRRMDDNGSFLYRKRVVRPPKVRILDGIIKVPRGSKALIYNPEGLMMAFLRGEIRNGVITVRTNRDLPYDMKRACTPSWEYRPETPISRLLSLGIGSAQLVTAIQFNMWELIIPA